VGLAWWGCARFLDWPLVREKAFGHAIKGLCLLVGIQVNDNPMAAYQVQQVRMRSRTLDRT
jgi:hypothetical protein